MKESRPSEGRIIPDISFPAPVKLSKLREHFREKYNLTTPQVEIMVLSSSKSLQQGLGDLAGILSHGEQFEKVKAIYHGLKGLLLNMGEKEWADYIKEVENKLQIKAPIDHHVIKEILHAGMVNVLNYSENK